MSNEEELGTKVGLYLEIISHKPNGIRGFCQNE